MAGRNLYNDTIGRFGSIAEAKQKGFVKQASPEGPSVFLSHIRADKETVKAFADYIGKADIDYYLDAEDRELQAAVEEGNDTKVTEFIEAGIRRCTDVMIFLSDHARKSWWVPYEIGFGKSAEKKLVCVRLTDVKVDDLSFLKIVRLIRTRKEFVVYVREMRKQIRYLAYGGERPRNQFGQLVNLLLEANLDDPAAGFHPLDAYMNPE